MGKRLFVVFDLDDTIANTEHRQHILDHPDDYETESDMWNAFFDACPLDPPNQEIIDVLDCLAEHSTIEIWTGRSDRVKEQTYSWLLRHLETRNFVLRMRKDGDYRHDIELKQEWVDTYGLPNLVFDDRNSVVKWWREQGVTCCQVKESDF